MKSAARAAGLAITCVAAGACGGRAEVAAPRAPLLREPTRALALRAGPLPLVELLREWTAAGGPAVAATALTAEELLRRRTIDVASARTLAPSEIATFVEELLLEDGFALAAGPGRPAALVTIEAWPGPPHAGFPPPAVGDADLVLLDAHPALIVSAAFARPPNGWVDAADALGMRSAVSADLVLCRGLARDVARCARRAQVFTRP